MYFCAILTLALPPLPMLDIHTHLPENHPHAILSMVPPRGFRPGAGRYYSLGIHPWAEAEFRQGLSCPWEELEALVACPEVRAVGEAGLDRARRPLPGSAPGCLREGRPGASVAEAEAWRKSQELLERHARLAERVGKPLVLHCVKAVDDVLALQKRLRPQVPWVFHGFRGNPQQACQLLRRGIYLSLGEHFHPGTAACIPGGNLLLETDASLLPIEEILHRVAVARYGAFQGKTRHFPGKALGLSSRSAALSPEVAGSLPQEEDADFVVSRAALRGELEANVALLFGV